MFQFSIPDIILIITMFSNFGIGLYVLLKYSGQKTNIAFSLLAFQVAIWNLDNLLSFIVNSEQWIILFAKLALFSVLFIPPTVCIFVLLFIGKPISKKIYLLFVPAILQVPFIFTPYNIAGFDGAPSGDNFIPGPLYAVYAVYFIALIVWSLVLLIRFIQHTDSYVKKQRSQYILLGIGLSAAIGITTNAILPLFWTANYNVYGTPATLVFSFCTAYAITRYRLFDIKFILRTSIIKGFGAIIATFFAVGFALGINEFLQGGFTSFVITLIIVLFFVQLIIFKIYRRFLYTPKTDFSAISDSIEFKQDVPEALAIIERHLQIALEKYKIKHFELVILDWKDKTYKSVTDNVVKLNHNSDLTNFVKNHTMILVSEELPEQLKSVTEPVRRNLQNFMDKHKFAFAIPLFTDMDIYGFIFITKKEVNQSGLYSKNLIADLHYLGRQFGGLLEKTLIYNAIVVEQVGVNSIH